tara:strand:- start:53 stop:1012 length:960 start_codon:yes stop_codon:yes gene_type:complete
MKAKKRSYAKGGKKDPPKKKESRQKGGTTADSLALYNAMLMQQRGIDAMRNRPNSPWIIRPEEFRGDFFDKVDFENFENETDRYESLQALKDGEENWEEEGFLVDPDSKAIGSELVEKYRALLFDDPVKIGLYEDSDIVHSRIQPVGTYFDGMAYSPIYAPPRSVKDIDSHPVTDTMLAESVKGYDQFYDEETNHTYRVPYYHERDKVGSSKYIKAKTKRRRPAPERMQSLRDRGKLSAPEKQLLARYLDADLRTKTGDRFKKFVNLKKDNRGVTRGVYDSDKPSYLEAPELYNFAPRSKKRETKASFQGGGKIKVIKK